MKTIKTTPPNAARIIAKIREGLDDADAGRVISDEELGRWLRLRYRSKPDRE